MQLQSRLIVAAVDDFSQLTALDACWGAPSILQAAAEDGLHLQRPLSTVTLAQVWKDACADVSMIPEGSSVCLMHARDAGIEPEHHQ